MVKTLRGVLVALLFLSVNTPASLNPKILPPVSNEDDRCEKLGTRLAEKYGIIALEKTDAHASVVLENLLFLLDHAFTPRMIKELRGFRYLFAYRGHDDHYDIAAYHPEAGAISIGGKSTYFGVQTEPISIVSALAHEIGHAFLLEKVTASELRSISVLFGGWGGVFETQPFQSLKTPVTDLFSNSFFKRYPDPENHETADIVRRRRKFSFASGYAELNIHEWFADAFAAFTLIRLGQKSLLGKNWRQRLIFNRKEKRDYWVNYNNLSGPFTHWFERKLEE